MKYLAIFLLIAAAFAIASAKPLSPGRISWGIGYGTHGHQGSYGHGSYGHGSYGHGSYGHGSYGHHGYGHHGYGHHGYGHHG